MTDPNPAESPTVVALQSENAALRMRVAELEAERELVVWTAKLGALVFGKALIGLDFARAAGSFADAIAAWQTGQRPFPAREAVFVAEAAFRRFVRVGLVTTVIAFLPYSCTMMQTALQWQSLEATVRLAEEQNRGIERQTALLATQADSARRGQIDQLRKDISPVEHQIEHLRSIAAACEKWRVELSRASDWAVLENVIDVGLGQQDFIETLNCGARPDDRTAMLAEVAEAGRILDSLYRQQHPERLNADYGRLFGGADPGSFRSWMGQRMPDLCMDAESVREQCEAWLGKATVRLRRLEQDEVNSLRRLVDEPSLDGGLAGEGSTQ